MISTTEDLALIVTRADDSMARIGPIGFRHVAEQMVRTFQSMATNTTGAAGARYAITSYAPEPGETYLPLVHASTYAVLDVIDDPVQGSEALFPDLWSRLHAQHGYETAERIWKNACAVMDAPDDEEN
ncbi:hypothetical protein [Streptomyces sp. NPDC088752]|uniref:hypothetical protein n=1 Tax=Streptomyces sp. NPDC088752 TaxID=3154963 RepID=UPI0034146784